MKKKKYKPKGDEVMGELKKFNHDLFGGLRTVLHKDEPLFNLMDVAFALGYTKQNSTGSIYLRKENVVKICKTLDVKAVSLDDTKTNIEKDMDFEKVFISEPDLYELTLESKAKNARLFRKWITNEVLPTIRKTGGYVANENMFVESYFSTLDETQKVMLKAMLENTRKLKEENSLLQPKAQYFDALVDRQLLTNFRDTAKQIGVGQNKLVNFLLDNGYLFRDAKQKLKPYARFVPELFQMKDWERNGKADVQTLVTPKGKETFRLLLRSEAV